MSHRNCTVSASSLDISRKDLRASWVLCPGFHSPCAKRIHRELVTLSCLREKTGRQSTLVLWTLSSQILQASHHIFISQSIHDLSSVCFFLNAPYLIQIVDSLTLDSQPAAPQLTPKWTQLIYHLYFSIRHITPSLHLRTPDSLSALHLRVILNSKITKKKHKNVKNVAGNRP